MVSRINKRKETKTGVKVHLGVGDLRLGEDLSPDRVAFAEARQKLEILGLRVCLGRDGQASPKTSFFVSFNSRYFQPKQHKIIKSSYLPQNYQNNPKMRKRYYVFQTKHNQGES